VRSYVAVHLYLQPNEMDSWHSFVFHFVGTSCKTTNFYFVFYVISVMQRTKTMCGINILLVLFSVGLKLYFSQNMQYGLMKRWYI
jgi:hypothetical protein